MSSPACDRASTSRLSEEHVAGEVNGGGQVQPASAVVNGVRKAWPAQPLARYQLCTKFNAAPILITRAEHDKIDLSERGRSEVRVPVESRSTLQLSG